MKPFKTKNILLIAAILLSSCAGPNAARRQSAFHTAYAYAFLSAKADRLVDDDYFKAQKKYAKARAHYIKGWNRGMAGLEANHPGFGEALKKNPGDAIMVTGAADIDLLYWTAASLGASIGLSLDKPEMLIRLPQVGIMAYRISELQPDYNNGAAWELLMAYEASRPAMMGGSIKLAQHYYEEALKYSKGQSAGLFVSYGESICVQQQDIATFKEMMNRALTVKGGGIVNRMARKRAKWLLTRLDDLFL